MVDVFNFLDRAALRRIWKPQSLQMIEARFVAVFERAFKNPKTRDNYVARLRGMMEKIGARTLLEVLDAPDEWYGRIQSAYPSLSTRKNLITAILVLFREDAELAGGASGEAARSRWKKLHDDLARHQNARVKRSEPEDKQIAKYTSFEEIERKYEDLRRHAPHETLRKSLKFLLLSIIVHLRPKRADLGSVHIFHNRDPRRTDLNYIVLRGRGEGASFLAMNLYKTSRHHQTIEEDLAEGLVRDIRQSLARWPREYLFVKDGGDPMPNNTYSQFVKRTFEEYFGRATGVSLLRHIYISEKLDFDDMTLEEQNEEARLMLHTSGLQKQYKWPKKVLCPKLCADYVPAVCEGASKRRKSRRKPKLPTPSRLKVGTRRRSRDLA